MTDANEKAMNVSKLVCTMDWITVNPFELDSGYALSAERFYLLMICYRFLDET